MVIFKPALFFTPIVLASTMTVSAAVKEFTEAESARFLQSFQNPELTVTQAEALVLELETYAGLSEDLWSEESPVWLDAVSNWPDPTQDPEIQALMAYAKSVKNPVDATTDCSTTTVINSGEMKILFRDVVCTTLPSNALNPVYQINDGGKLFLNGFTIRTDDGSGNYLDRGLAVLMRGNNPMLFGGGFNASVGRIEGFETAVDVVADSPVIQWIAANHNGSASIFVGATNGQFRYIQANHNAQFGIFASNSQDSQWEYVQANDNIVGISVFDSLESEWKYIQANHNTSIGIDVALSQADSWQYVQANHNGQTMDESFELDSISEVAKEAVTAGQGLGLQLISTGSEWKHIQANDNGPTVEVTLESGMSATLDSVGMSLQGSENHLSHVQANRNGSRGAIKTTHEIGEVSIQSMGVNLVGNGNALNAVYTHHNGDHLTIQGTKPAPEASTNILDYFNVGVSYSGNSNTFTRVFSWYNGNHLKASHMRLGDNVSLSNTAKPRKHDAAMAAIQNTRASSTSTFTSNSADPELENVLHSVVVFGNGSHGRFPNVPAGTVIQDFNSVGLLLLDGQTTVAHSLALFNGEQGGYEIEGCESPNATNLMFGCTSAGIQIVNGRIGDVFSGFNGLKSQLKGSVTAGIINELAPVEVQTGVVSIRIPIVVNSWAMDNRSPGVHPIRGYGLVSVATEMGEGAVMTTTGTSPTTIVYNTFAHNDIGLEYLGFGSSPANHGGIYYNQVFENTQDGMVIRGNDNEVAHNHVERNGHDGIVVADYDGAEISHGNLIERNTSLLNKGHNIVDTGEPLNCSAHYNTWKQNVIANNARPACLQP